MAVYLPLDEHVCPIVNKKSWEYVCLRVRKGWQRRRFLEAE